MEQETITSIRNKIFTDILAEIKKEYPGEWCENKCFEGAVNFLEKRIIELRDKK